MSNNQSLLMVIVSGKDRPGITARFSRILMEQNVELVDIEQASLQNLLGLYFILDFSKTTHSQDSVIKELLFEASQLGVSLNFRLYAPGEIETLNQRNLYVLTHFGGTPALAAFSNILAEENVNIERISSASHHGSHSVEMTINVYGVSSMDLLKRRLMVKSRELGVGLGLQKMEAYRKNKRIIFFDMDSTLVDMEVIDEMARRAGVHREVARITGKAMRGEFDFEMSLIQRVALLKGLSEKALSEIRDNISLSPGVEDLVTTLKYLGYRLGIVTGGFDFFAHPLKEKLGFDFACANQLEIKDGKLTGKLLGEIVDAARKARFVNQTACDQGILLDQTVCVGDGANDALMLAQAGLAIAYNAKKGLDRSANVALGKSSMTDILHLLGITEEDIGDALACKAV
jgi:phosphoserine phosphatase